MAAALGIFRTADARGNGPPNAYPDQQAKVTEDPIVTDVEGAPVPRLVQLVDPPHGCHARAMAPSPPPRYSPAELIEELREAAEEIAPELNGIKAEETMEGEAAQTIEEMLEALMRIANGAPRSQEIARAVLETRAPLKPIGRPKNTVVKMQKPRR